MRMGVIAFQAEVLVAEIEDGFHFRVQHHPRQRPRFTTELRARLLQVVAYRWASPNVWMNSCACRPVACAIIMVNSAYEAILNGTPRNTSALRWYSWQDKRPSAT